MIDFLIQLAGRGSNPCAIGFVLLLIGGLASVASPQERPNLLLIVADDLGYSDLGCFGGEIETPQLDSLAVGGVRLTQFYNAGRCCPSRAALLTGQYPHRVGLGHMTTDLGQIGYRGRVSEDAITIAERLRRVGYRTFLSGKWHLGTADPTEQGFEEFFGTLASAKTFWDADHYLRLPLGRPRREYRQGEFYGTDALVDHAIDFLASARSSPGKPWFLYLAFNAPHFPLQAPAREIAKYADVYRVGWDVIRSRRLARMKQIEIVEPDTKLSPRSPYWDWGEPEPRPNPPWDELPADRRGDLARRMAIYAAMVDRLDQAVGRLLADLKVHGEFDNTLILFTSDNGACFEWDPFGFDIRSSPNNILHWGDELEPMGGPGTFHSVGSGWANASNTPWRMYKHYNHEGGIASPGIVHWPAKLSKAGAIVSTPAHVIDVLPTLLEAGGITYPIRNAGGSRTLTPAGVSLLPVLRGEVATERTLFFEHQGNRAVRRGNWKLCALRGQPWELYDVGRDRIEQNNLAATHSDLVQELSAAWNDWAAENHVIPFPDDYRAGYLAPLK
jgi:arylsulfatase